MEYKKNNCGRKEGVRSQKYEDAIRDFMLGKGSVAEIAKKYKIDRSGLNRAINSTKESTKPALSGKDLKDFVKDTKAHILQGISNLENLKNSPEKIHNEIAEDIMEELRMSNLKTAKFIHALGQRLLKDLLRETDALRDSGLLNLNNIQTSFKTLETASNFLGIPKTPMVAIQNNIQNNTLNNQRSNDKKEDFNINLNFVENKKKDIIDAEVVSKDDS